MPKSKEYVHTYPLGNIFTVTQYFKSVVTVNQFGEDMISLRVAPWEPDETDTIYRYRNNGL